MPKWKYELQGMKEKPVTLPRLKFLEKK